MAEVEMVESFGVSIMILVILAVTWLIPVAASIWAILTLHRIHTGQQAIGAQLEAIARTLHAGRT